jgi:hypothetical protein
MNIEELNKELDNIGHILEEEDSALFNFDAYDKSIAKLKLVKMKDLSVMDRTSIGESKFKMLESIVEWDSLLKQAQLRRRLTYY